MLRLARGGFRTVHPAGAPPIDPGARRTGPAPSSVSGHPRRRYGAAQAYLLDGELAQHAALAVAGHGAVVRVLAGLQVDGDLRHAAVLNDRALLVEPAALDRDVVRRRGLVRRVDLDHAGRGRCDLREIGELAVGVGGDVELSALRRDRLAGAGGLNRRAESARVLAAQPGDAGDVRRDVGCELALDELGGHVALVLLGQTRRMQDLLMDDAANGV